MVKNNKAKFLSKRKNWKQKHALSVQSSYYNQHLEDERMAQQNREKVEQLEQEECSLLDRLQATINKQANMHKTLENLVKHGSIK